MAKNNKEKYKQENEAFLEEVREKPGVQELRYAVRWNTINYSSTEGDSSIFTKAVTVKVTRQKSITMRKNFG